MKKFHGGAFYTRYLKYQLSAKRNQIEIKRNELIQ